MFGCAGSLMLPTNFLQLRGAGLTLGVGLFLWGKGSRGEPSGCSTRTGLLPLSTWDLPQTRDQTCVSGIGRRILYHRAAREALMSSF